MKTKYIREVVPHYKSSKTEPFSIRVPEHIAHFVRSILTTNSKEHFIALYLNSNYEVSAYSIISIGTANQSLVMPREVFQAGILAGAVSICVAHNHPSGNVAPSKEDNEVTAKLKQAGEVLAIKLLDHVIVSDSAHYSYREQGDILN